MNACKVPDAAGDHWRTDSYPEMEQKLNSLRSLVCDLLKANEELRNALHEASSGVQGNTEALPSLKWNQRDDS